MRTLYSVHKCICWLHDLFLFHFWRFVSSCSCLCQLCVYCWSYTQALLRGSADLVPVSSRYCLGALVHGALSFSSGFLGVRGLELRVWLLASRAQVQRLALTEFLEVFLLLCLECRDWRSVPPTQLILTVVNDCGNRADRSAGNLEFEEPGLCAICHFSDT